MGDRSAIQWTDASWNPVTGCSKVSPGCAHCYAEGVADRFWATQYPPITERVSMMDAAGYPAVVTMSRRRQFTDVLSHEDRLDQPLRWRKPRKVFVNSMSDLFHEDVPDAFIDRVFAVMALAPWHTFQVLTKRADRMRDYCSSLTFERVRVWMNRASDGDELMQPTPGGGFTPNWKENLTTIARRTKQSVYRFDPLAMPTTTPPPPFPNVWLGVSVENQHFADERIPLLLQTPAAVRFLSCEPLLGPVTFRWAKWDNHGPHARRERQLPPVERDGRILAGSVDHLDGLRMLDWVIVGGESGRQARSCDLAWSRSIVAQCKAALVPCFVKQLGAKPTCDGCGDAAAVFGTRDSHGGDPEEWPADLRVREFPTVVL